MNFRLVANITSYVLWVEAGFLLLPLAVSVFSGEAWLPFFITAVLCVLIGGALHLVPVKNRKMHGRDGFMAVALSWIALSLMGALPYVLTGALDSYVDAVFETVSGLTTTGSTVFPEVEHLPYSVLLWRSLTQWMGGMGVLVLFLALMPKLGDGAVYLMRAVLIVERDIILADGLQYVAGGDRKLPRLRIDGGYGSRCQRQDLSERLLRHRLPGKRADGPAVIDSLSDIHVSFLSYFAALAALMDSISSGTTLNRSPTIP